MHQPRQRIQMLSAKNIQFADCLTASPIRHCSMLQD
jgi:hypothetical protein